MFFRQVDPTGCAESVFALVAAAIGTLRSRVALLDRRRNPAGKSDIEARRKTDTVGRARNNDAGGFTPIKQHL